MLLDVEDLHSYLEDAFNHFASMLDFPFDFIQASFQNSPISPDSGGSILKLALTIWMFGKTKPTQQQYFLSSAIW